MINTEFLGNLQAPVVQTLAGATTTTIGSAMPDKNRTLAGFQFVNTTGAAVACVLYWYDSTSAAEKRIWSGSVAAGETGPDGNKTLPVKLLKTDEIRAKGASGVDVVLYYSIAPQTTAESPWSK